MPTHPNKWQPGSSQVHRGTSVHLSRWLLPATLGSIAFGGLKQYSYDLWAASIAFSFLYLGKRTTEVREMKEHTCWYFTEKVSQKFLSSPLTLSPLVWFDNEISLCMLCLWGGYVLICIHWLECVHVQTLSQGVHLLNTKKKVTCLPCTLQQPLCCVTVA